MWNEMLITSCSKSRFCGVIVRALSAVCLQGSDCPRKMLLKSNRSTFLQRNGRYLPLSRYSYHGSEFKWRPQFPTEISPCPSYLITVQGSFRGPNCRVPQYFSFSQTQN